MSAVADKFVKVLTLEIKKGCKNTAIAGGFLKFLPFIQSVCEIQGLPPELSEAIKKYFSNYPHYIIEDRLKINQLLVETFQSLQYAKASLINALIDQGINRLINSEEPPKLGQDPAIFSSIKAIKGIGEKNFELFNRLGVSTIYDLLHYYPRRYQDYSKLKTISQLMYGDEISVMGTITHEIFIRKTNRRNFSIAEAVLADQTGNIQVSWFNQPFIKRQLKKGTPIILSGKVDAYRGRLVINNPDWELIDSEQINTNRIVPIYPLTSGISQKKIRKLIKNNLPTWSNRLVEYLPTKIIGADNFMTIGNTLEQIHFPDDQQSLIDSRKRLAFEEIFFLQLGVLYSKEKYLGKKAKTFLLPTERKEKLQSELPFKLTNAQIRAIEEINCDLASGSQMHRLLQGDVGSGKTIVAGFAIESILGGNAQSAVMAPTGILAEQHFTNFSDMLLNSSSIQPDEIALLTGKTTKQEKNSIYNDLRSGKIRVVVGTHALIEDPVYFDNLQLVIIDEQHRFGVNQRNILRGKGSTAHFLAMTATPIPRSLAMTVFGDLDVSIIDEMPKGRIDIQTQILAQSERNKAYALIQDQIRKGFQAFIVYPYIDSEHDQEDIAAKKEFQRLRNTIFKDFRVGLMHGQLPNQEKDVIMDSFRNNEFDILVSTTVIEVGVDIPDATVMLIEGANHFGLAQLHQIRGRVGRSRNESYCLLIPENDQAQENERLIALTQTNDGFLLAEKDLKHRGPGEFLGTQQSGFAGFNFASFTNIKIINQSMRYAKDIIRSDPNLDRAENKLLKEALTTYWPNLKE